MTTTRPARRLLATSAAVALGAATLLGACGDDDDSTATTTTEAAETTTEAAEEPAGDELEITGAWARTSPAVATAGAVYMEITNPTDTDDALVGASVDPSVAATVELHETTMADDGGTEGEDDAMEGSDDAMTTTTAMGGSTDTTEGGMMSMSPVDEIPVPAGETAVLEPGGYHVMLLDLVEPLEVGSTIEVTLTFAEAGEVVLSVDVLDSAP
jgi:copper(I)-binding protein